MTGVGIIARSVGTHDGHFHADEVTACSLLYLFGLVDRERIVRTRDLARLAECEYVCDVGGEYDLGSKRFDHHQAEYQGEWSSAGMVLDYLRRIGKISTEDQLFFRDTLIKGVDDHDNGRSATWPGVQTFSHIVGNFSPIEYGAPDVELDRAFHQAMDFVVGHLERLWGRYLYTRGCREIVRERMAEQGRCMVFERAIPWMDSFFQMGGENHSALFVIMPSGEHWKLRGIPPNSTHRMDVRVPLPLDWAGLLDEHLKEATGIPGAIFCHKGRFISVWETKADAQRALEVVLKRNGYDDGV